MPGKFLFLSVGCVLLCLPASSLAQNRSDLFPKTTDGVHLEMVFNYNLANVDRETGIVDMVWGSNYANEPAGVYNTAYIPHSVDNFTYPVSWYQANHPDWLEYQCDRKTLAFEFGTTTLAPLDIANPEVQAFQWTNWVDAPLSQGYGGIAVDTMDLTNDWGRCGHFDVSGTWVQQYTGNSDDPAFRHDVLAWESATYQHTQEYSSTATMQVNVSYQFGVSNRDNLQLMTTTDLLFDERGFTNWGAGASSVTPEEWLGIVKALRYVQSKGLCYMTNGEEPVPVREISLSERLWVIANYLLVKNDCTYMYMTGSQGYGDLVVFSEYKIKIGHPTSDMKKKHGVWERELSNGLTLVNPYNTTAKVPLPPGNYRTLKWKRVGKKVEMAPHSGLVLRLVK